MTQEQEIKKIIEVLNVLIEVLDVLSDGASWHGERQRAKELLAEFTHDAEDAKGTEKERREYQPCDCEIYQSCPRCKPTPEPASTGGDMNQNIEKLARELKAKWLGESVDFAWLTLARHVDEMIREAVNEEAKKGIRINDNWIKTSQQIVDDLNAKHALALKAAKKFKLVEAKTVVGNCVNILGAVQAIDRLIAQLNKEEAGT